jgi:L-serine dehydratase
MTLSVLDIFSVSIGPSSSHTAGPMRAAFKFINKLKGHNKNKDAEDDIKSIKVLPQVKRIAVELYGSLALTGKGHGTDKAILLGLEGHTPKTASGLLEQKICQPITHDKTNLFLGGKYSIEFDYKQDCIWHYNEALPLHANGMRFTAYNSIGNVLATEEYYSIGGGFVVRAKEFDTRYQKTDLIQKYPFTTATELWQYCETEKKSIREIMLDNETCWRPIIDTKESLLNVSRIMQECIEHGCQNRGILPGPLSIRRRASNLYSDIMLKNGNFPDHLRYSNLINAYAMAVAEENAVGRRIIAAPTNGASGVVPAVLQYYKEFYKDQVTEDSILTFLLTAGAIAIIYKLNASISGAEVGCQGEIGVACSMAAGGLVAALNGTNQQIDKAAKIAMTHNLGLTCDPVKGYVQIPCIERNGISANKAVNAATLTLLEGEEAEKTRISLDQVVLAMLRTGQDMNSHYKETSLGGLAVCSLT